MTTKTARLSILAREIRLIDSIKGNVGSEIFGRFVKLGSLFRKHTKLCERYCSEDGFKPELIDQTEMKIKREVEGLNAFLDGKLNVEFQHDPRGLTARLYVKDEYICELTR